MSHLIDVNSKIMKLVDLLRTSGGLRVDAQVIETVPQSPSAPPAFTVEIFGEDAPVLLYNDGELLAAVRHIAVEMLHLEPQDDALLRFDVDSLRPVRREELQRLALSAVLTVRRTSQPYAFAPMTSAERRILHLALAASGHTSVSTGYGFKRCVVLYPEGVTPPAERSQMPQSPRNSQPRRPAGKLA